MKKILTFIGAFFLHLFFTILSIFSNQGSIDPDIEKEDIGMFLWIIISLCGFIAIVFLIAFLK